MKAHWLDLMYQEHQSNDKGYYSFSIECRRQRTNEIDHILLQTYS